jgi:hypothetical protein
MAGRTIDIDEVFGTPERLAEIISNFYDEWNAARRTWISEKKELRNYIFATDTTSTANKLLPWKNSTTTPKLTQIRDNLHANYMATLFPNDDWLSWEGAEEEDETDVKKEAILNYMKNKIQHGGFETQVSKLVYDFIDNGNVFADTEFVDTTTENSATGEVYPGYVGPLVNRISPHDIVFNPLVSSFERSPKIIRKIMTLGDVAVMMDEQPNSGYLQEVFDSIRHNRDHLTAISESDLDKSDGFKMDGFGTFLEYYNSGYVEILEFHGDIYDVQEEKLLKNYIVTVVDRRMILRKVPNPSWRQHSIRHAGWRLRPDNLYAMGPLDNLVGMQYRIDHLENLKADVFDFIAHPVQKVRGYVEDYEYEPGGKIFLGDDGDVEFMRPDTTALNADLQIATLEARMEELAGAPRQAMGIRTPGEKTAFEVQTLDNASSRTFMNKVNYFEKEILEKILNDMLEQARRNMDSQDTIRVLDDELGAVVFSTITKEDLNANGRLRPIGSRHFAQKANSYQNLLSLMNSAVGQDPDVKVHISGLKLAQMAEEVLGLTKFELVVPNIRVVEAAETQRLLNTIGQQIEEEAATPGPEEQAIAEAGV